MSDQHLLRRPDFAEALWELPDGRVSLVTGYRFSGALLTVSERRSYEHTWDEAWEYPNAALAVTALAEWDGTGDPPDGWTRHWPSARRRPNGDPAQEYVHP